MKKCIKCGFESDDLSGFCSQCGSPLSVAEAVTENIDVAPVQPSMNGVPTLQETAPVVEEASVPKKKKKKKFLFVLIPILIVLLIGGGIATYFIFFMSSPAFDIIDAGIKTVESGSFTFKTDIDGKKFEGKAVIDFDDKDLQLLMEDDYGNVMGIYDRTSFEIYTNEYEFYNPETGMYQCETETNTDTDDISVLLEAFFDAWEFSKETFESKDVDWDAFFDLLENVFGRDEDDLREDVEEYIDLENATAAIKQTFALLADEDWLEETLGLEEEKKDGATQYSFDINFEELAETIEETFGDCSRSEDVDEFLNRIVDEMDRWSYDHDDFIKVKGKIVIEDGYISEIDIRVGGEGGSDRIKIEISDVGETELDEDELQECLDKCDENSESYTIPNIPYGGVVW